MRRTRNEVGLSWFASFRAFWPRVGTSYLKLGFNDGLSMNFTKSRPIAVSELLNWLISCAVGAISNLVSFLFILMTDSSGNCQSECKRSFLLSAAFSTFFSIDRKYLRSASWGMAYFAVSRNFTTKCLVWRSFVTMLQESGCSRQTRHPNDSRKRCSHENLIVNLQELSHIRLQRHYQDRQDRCVHFYSLHWAPI